MDVTWTWVLPFIKNTSEFIKMLVQKGNIFLCFILKCDLIVTWPHREGGTLILEKLLLMFIPTGESQGWGVFPEAVGRALTGRTNYSFVNRRCPFVSRNWLISVHSLSNLSIEQTSCFWLHTEIFPSLLNFPVDFLQIFLWQYFLWIFV